MGDSERDTVVAVLEAYMRAFETGTREDLQAFCLQPVGYVTDDEVQLRKRYPFDPVVLRDRTGLHASDMAVDVLHCDGHRAHVSIEGARRRADGSVIETIEALYILNKVDGAWKISLISGIRRDPA